MTSYVEPMFSSPDTDTVLCCVPIWFRPGPESFVDRSPIKPSPVSLRVRVRRSNPEVATLLTDGVSQESIFSFSFHLDEARSQGGTKVSGLGPAQRVSYQAVTLTSTSSLLTKLQAIHPHLCKRSLRRSTADLHKLRSLRQLGT